MDVSLNEVYHIEIVEGLKDGLDVNLYFFGNKVELPAMYLIVALTTIILITIYIVINKFHRRKNYN